MRAYPPRCMSACLFGSSVEVLNGQAISEELRLAESFFSFGVDFFVLVISYTHGVL